MQMGAYNTIPFFRVDKESLVLGAAAADQAAATLRLRLRCPAGLQGFVAQCTDVLGNRLVPLNARQQVRLLHTCAAPVSS